MNPRSIEHIHMMGIGGIGMGTLAAMLKAEGFHLTGSDNGKLYPPMSTQLESLGIPVYEGYGPEHLEKSRPGLVVVGNHIRRDNPEAQWVLQQAIPYLSMPEVVRRFFLSRHASVVVAGTHGKSTTAALLARVLETGGTDPSAFVGAIVKNWGCGCRVGRGPFMVVEGDEYDTAFFDKGPKFLHYCPQIAVVTGVEYDHADIYPNLDSVVEAFRRFVRLVPPEGCLVIHAEDPRCELLAGECRGRVVRYGVSQEAHWRLLEMDHGPDGTRFRYRGPSADEGEMSSRLLGRLNAVNSLAVLAAARQAGLSFESIQKGLLDFQGIVRRQDFLGEPAGVLVIDDFAHHPTAVRGTIEAVRQHYRERRLIAVFEPRTNTSRRRIFQDEYAAAFAEAGGICIKKPPDLEGIPEAERFDAGLLVESLRERGKEAFYFSHSEGLLEFLKGFCRGGDVVLCMSNGSFDHLPRRLVDALASEEDSAA